MKARYGLVLLIVSGALGLVVYGCSLQDSGSPGDDGGSDSNTTGDAQIDHITPESCTPADESGFMPAAYIKPKQALGACTSAQISGYIAACLKSSSTQAGCNTFTNDANNRACLTCAVGPIADPTAAVLYDSSGQITVNTPGCVYLADPTNGPTCVQNFNNLQQCSTAACSSAACMTDQGIQNRCKDFAGRAGATCDKYKAAVACFDTELQSGPAAGCASPANLGAEEQARWFSSTITVFCGTGGT